MKLNFLPKANMLGMVRVASWVIFVLLLGYEAYLLFNLYHTVNSNTSSETTIKAVRIEKQQYFDAEKMYNDKFNYLAPNPQNVDPFARTVGDMRLGPGAGVPGSSGLSVPPSIKSGTTLAPASPSQTTSTQTAPPKSGP